MDIYFAVLNFTLSGAIGLVGILTLQRVNAPRDVIFASLPLLFALHQFTEGFVWLGMGGYIEPRVLKIASGIFIYYAQGLLPVLIPLAIWLIEKDTYRKKLLGMFTILGVFLAIYTMYGLSTVPYTVTVINGNTLYYNNLWTTNIYNATIYVITTCGSLMLSSSISIQLFGFLNFLGLILIFLLRPYGFTSLWCLYAAVISGLLYFYYIESRIKFLQDLKERKEEFNLQFEKELSALNARKSLFKR